MLLLLLMFFVNQPLMASTESKTLKIMFIGDSLTAGYGLSREAAYPAQLQDLFRSAGYSVEVVNGGVSGDTTKGGLRRLKWQLKAQPDWVVLALGGNDMLRGIPPEKTEEHLEEMIRYLKSQNKKIFLFGMQASGTLGESFVEEFNSIYPRLARKHSTPYLPLFIAKVVNKPKLNLKDGIHPNAEGQKIVAKDVFEFLQPHLAETQRNSKND